MTNFITNTQLKRKLISVVKSACQLFYSHKKAEKKSTLSCNIPIPNSDNNVHCKYFFSDYDSAPALADYINRIISLSDSAASLITNEADKNKLNELLDNSIQYLEEECDITPKLQRLKESYEKLQSAEQQKEYNKKRLEIIENANKKFNEIIFRIIWGTNKPSNFLTKLIRPLLKSFLGDNYPVNIIKLISHKDESNASALSRLKKAEIELRKSEGRPELINLFNLPTHSQPNELFFCHQTPVARYTRNQMQELGIDEGEEQYFHPASVNQDEGVANFNRETLVKFDINEQVSIQRSFYTHCALPPLGVEDEFKRMDMTVRNVEQVIETLAEKTIAEKLEADPNALNNNSNSNPLTVSLTELRLLSMVRNNFIFNFFDKSQHQYEQTLEMFLAFNMLNDKTLEMPIKQNDGSYRTIYIKADIWFGNFGVNGFRNEIYCDELLNVINTRYLNQLFDECQHSTLNGVATLSEEHQDLKQNIADNQLDLKLNFGVLHFLLGKIKDNPEYKERFIAQQKNILSLLLKAHEKEKALLVHNKQWIERLANIPRANFNANTQALISNLSEVKNLIETPLHPLLTSFSHTFNSAAWIPRSIKNILTALTTSVTNGIDNYFSFLKRYTTAENNYWLPTILARINDHLNRELLIGCRENKDRGGRLNATLMADSIYKQTYHKFPKCDNPQDKTDFNKLLAWILPRSTAFFNSEYCSVPGARGFDIQTQHGNEHLAFLKENKAMARWGKDIFSPVLGFKLVDFLSSIKNAIVKRLFTNDANPTTQNSVNVSNQKKPKLIKRLGSAVGAATFAAALVVSPSLAAPTSGYETGASIISINSDAAGPENLDALFNDQVGEKNNPSGHKTSSKDKSMEKTRGKVRDSIEEILSQLNAASHQHSPGKHAHRGKKKNEEEELATERADAANNSTRPMDPELNLIFDENEINNQTRSNKKTPNPKNPYGDDTLPLVERANNTKLQDSDDNQNDGIKNFLRRLREQMKSSVTADIPVSTVDLEPLLNNDIEGAANKPPTPLRLA